MKTPLQQLTTLIYASNPELLTLGVGCEFHHEKYGNCICITYQEELNTIAFIDEKEHVLGRCADNDIEIIGKPPTLVDVLKWAKLPFETAEETYFSYGLIRERLLELWSLNSIYLRDQSTELINFLINLNNG